MLEFSLIQIKLPVMPTVNPGNVTSPIETMNI